MSSTVARTVDRPIGRYAPPDWHARNSKLSEVTRACMISCVKEGFKRCLLMVKIRNIMKVVK